MNTTKYLAAAASLLMACAMVSCDEEKNEPSTKNHVYISTSAPTTLLQGTEAELTFNVTLSAPVSEATVFELTAEGSAAQAIIFDNENVTVAAGSNTATFAVTIDGDFAPADETSAEITLKNLNTAAFDVKETVTLTIVPAAQIGAAEIAFAKAFKEATGIDLSDWFGDVALTGSIEFPGGGSLSPFGEPTTIDLAGVTTFHLNPASTLENVMLDMTSNPMGMSRYLEDSFRKLTVEDKEFFALEDEDNYGGPELMALINWNANTAETFKATLPAMTLDFSADGKKATINFVKEGENFYLDANGEPFVDEYGDPILMTWSEDRIGFEYSYSAWDRNLAKLMAGDPTALELLPYGCTAHPGAWLGMSSVSYDEWGLEEEGEVSLYCEPKGEIDFEKGTMTFEFPFDHADQYGYSRVKVVYTIAK